MTEIKQIINSIKDITNDGTSPVNIINFGGIMKSNFLKISNGAILFDNEFKGVPLGAACKIYSSSDLKITDSIQKVPILLLQDIGEIFIDINRYKKTWNIFPIPE